LRLIYHTQYWPGTPQQYVIDLYDWSQNILMSPIFVKSRVYWNLLKGRPIGKYPTPLPPYFQNWWSWYLKPPPRLVRLKCVSKLEWYNGFWVISELYRFAPQQTLTNNRNERYISLVYKHGKNFYNRLARMMRCQHIFLAPPLPFGQMRSSTSWSLHWLTDWLPY